MNIISNNYGVGEGHLFIKGRSRIHTDDSIEIKYYDKPENTLDGMAFSLTGDLGCEYGSGVSCYGDKKGRAQAELYRLDGAEPLLVYRDLFGVTVGGGQINNPGRYLVLIPPINGEGAISAATNSPYFTGNPGDPFKAWDSSITFDYMPKQYITFRAEYDYRHASVPYWTGRGGTRPPAEITARRNSLLAAMAPLLGKRAGASRNCLRWSTQQRVVPGSSQNESFIDLAIMVKF